MQPATTSTRPEVRPPPPAATPRPASEIGERALRRGVGACVAVVGAFLALRLTAWPPHEDEALALFVGYSSLGELAGTVLGERGGAPLHFVAAWIVAHLGGGLTGLRAVSALFALASIPLVAALASRLADRTVGLTAAALASGTWVLLFHGIYARMYSLFLFTSLLSYLALLVALRRGGTRRWTLWTLATLAAVAAHPYGALVLGSQALYVLLVRERVREAVLAFGALAVLGTPFWISDLVLAGRFDVGVGGGGGTLGNPLELVAYLGTVAGDFSAGPVVLPVTLALFAAGLVLLGRDRPRSALLAGAVFAAPTLALLLARLGHGASPETRHLIFALPFFATVVATALAALARLRRPGARQVAVAVAALLVAGGPLWAWEKTPLLFEGEPAARAEGREAAASWLAETGRADDVLLGFEPVFLDAWRRNGESSRTVLPRADARLAARTLERARKPLGRGVWVFNAHSTNNRVQRLEIDARRPRPAEEFEARAFGPYLVVRTLEPTRTTDTYLQQAARALILGRHLGIGDADVNFDTVVRVAQRLGYEASASASSSRSTSSR